MMRQLLALLALAAMASPVSGQMYGDDAAAFAGVKAFNARVAFDWDDGITQKTEAQFTRELESAFQLGVLRAGAQVRDDAPNYLWCELYLLYNDGLVALSIDVKYWERIAGRWVQTWNSGAVGIVGGLNLDGRRYGTTCAERFEFAYRTANPGR